MWWKCSKSIVNCMYFRSTFDTSTECRTTRSAEQWKYIENWGAVTSCSFGCGNICSVLLLLTHVKDTCPSQSELDT